MKKLIIAGTGIKFLSHLTYETQFAVKTCDCVLYLLNEPAIKKWIDDNAKKAFSLDDIYFSNKNREESYHMIERAVESYLENHEHVCFITYGNPIFFSSFTSNIVTTLKQKKISVDIIPAISSLDCLYTDLVIDPSDHGIQSFEATSFILNNQMFTSDTPLIIWQIGVIGITDIIKNKIDLQRRSQFINIFVNKLMENFSPNHECFHYVASQYPGVQSSIIKMTLDELRFFNIDRLATLYIPPEKSKSINSEVLELLKNN